MGLTSKYAFAAAMPYHPAQIMMTLFDLFEIEDAFDIAVNKTQKLQALITSKISEIK